MFLTENNILTPCMSVWVSKRSFNYTTAIENTNSWLLNMDAGMINGVLFLDLCKAFDTVDHKILIKQLLYICGIQNKCLD
jgi:hypothetical protein